MDIEVNVVSRLKEFIMNNANITLVTENKGFSLKGLVDGTKAKAKEIYGTDIIKTTEVRTPEVETAEQALKELTKARQDAIDGINLAFNAKIEAQRAVIAELKKAIAPAVAQAKIQKAMNALGESLGKLQ